MRRRACRKGLSLQVNSFGEEQREEEQLDGPGDVAVPPSPLHGRLEHVGRRNDLRGFLSD